jgi:hypothetical protein
VVPTQGMEKFEGHRSEHDKLVGTGFN